MVTLQQVQTGLFNYIDREWLPHMTGLKKVGLTAYMTLAAGNLTALAAKYINHPAIAGLGIVDEQGCVDIDKAYTAVIPSFNNGAKHSIELPLIGSVTLDRSDIDKLHRYILGG